jgi:hypothetical protein
MAASINGSQIQSAAQSLAAYLQALQAKTDSGTNTNVDGKISSGDIANGAAVVNGSGQAKKTASTAKDQAEQASNQPLDVVSLSAEAQRLLANAQTTNQVPGSLAGYLNVDNTVNAISDPLGTGYVGAIAQFRQWLAAPLGQPVGSPGNETAIGTTKANATTAVDQNGTGSVAPVTATST